MAEPSRFKKKVHFGGTLPPPGLACGAFVLTRARGTVALRGAGVVQDPCFWSCAFPQKAIVCMTALPPMERARQDAVKPHGTRASQLCQDPHGLSVL